MESMRQAADSGSTTTNTSADPAAHRKIALIDSSIIGDDDEMQHEQELFGLTKDSDAKSCLFALTRLSVPVVISFFLQVGATFINLVFAGQYTEGYDTTSTVFTGVSLSNMFGNVSCLSILIGMTGAVETLASQHNGAQRFQEVGYVLQRSCVILMVMMLLHTGFSGGLVTVAGGVLPTATLPFRPTTPHAIPMLLAFILSGFLFVYKGLSLIPALWPILHDLPGGKICILDDDTGVAELDAFSKVYADEKLANEDDDYYLDELENLRRHQTVFLQTLDSKIGTGDTLDSLYARAKAAVEPTDRKESTELCWYGQVSDARQ